MNRIQLACYSLLASAFILGGLLLVNLGPRMTSRADAAMVIARDNFTLMTAMTRSQEEALFVLDNLGNRLLVYRLDLGRNRLELAGAADLAQIFAVGAAPAQRGGGR
jgi:hypothetical protein